MVVRMRHTRGHTNNRRSHHALAKPGIIATETGFRQSHRVDPVTGMYRGRVVIDVTRALAKKAEKNA